jgi:broad specificity phosphatase PhoE
MSTTVIHLLRHGKVHNPGNILYGRLPNYRLAASGRAMAAGVADYLAGSDVSYLAASSLQRAQETAAPLGVAFGLPTVTDDRIIEAANDFEGQSFTLNSIRSRKGALSNPRNWPKFRDPRLPSWGEPYLEIAHRMLAAVYAAVQVADGHEAVLVSHQLPIVTIRRYLQGQRLWHDPRRRECSVASLTTLTFRDGVFSGVRYTEPVAAIPAVNDPVDDPVADPLASLTPAIDPEGVADTMLQGRATVDPTVVDPLVRAEAKGDANT